MKNVAIVVVTLFFTLGVKAESRSAFGIGMTKLDACGDAKRNVENLCETKKVARFGSCSCEEAKTPPSYEWKCEVEAICESTSSDDRNRILDSET